jgi:hypothetical protein
MSAEAEKPRLTGPEAIALARAVPEAAGAAVGAVFGAMLDEEQPGRGALIGGTIGFLVGMAAHAIMDRDAWTEAWAEIATVPAP